MDSEGNGQAQRGGKRREPERSRTCGLTERELEVVVLLAEGLTNDQIASELVLSPRTVQSHVSNAMKRTRTQSRTQLAVLALREGLVPIEQKGGP
jgi:DNA-binding NarL/FixJ family response regulator